MEPLSHALAGAAGGVIAMALLYPLENVRTRLQVQIEQRNNKHISTTNGTTASHNHSEEHIDGEDAQPIAQHYTGTVDCILQVWRSEGWRALYSGLMSALIGVGVSSAVYFWWYHLFRARLLRIRKRHSLGAVDNLLIAAVAGVLNILCTLPIWVIQTRQTLARKHQPGYSTITQTFRTILREEGPAGLYKGLVPSLILVSNPAIQFLAYEQLVRALSAFYRRRHVAATTLLTSVTTTTANTPTTSPIAPTPLPALSSLDFFALGALAKAIATVLTYPTQVVKSRLQSEEGKAMSVWAMGSEVRRMWREEGMAVFFNGMSAKMLQTVLNSAFLFMFYEKLADIMLRLIRSAWQAEQTVRHIALQQH